MYLSLYIFAAYPLDDSVSVELWIKCLVKPWTLNVGQSQQPKAVSNGKKKKDNNDQMNVTTVLQYIYLFIEMKKEKMKIHAHNR